MNVPRNYVISTDLLTIKPLVKMLVCVDFVAFVPFKKVNHKCVGYQHIYNELNGIKIIQCSTINIRTNYHQTIF